MFLPEPRSPKNNRKNNRENRGPAFELQELLIDEPTGGEPGVSLGGGARAKIDHDLEIALAPH